MWLLILKTTLTTELLLNCVSKCSCFMIFFYALVILTINSLYRCYRCCCCFCCLVQTIISAAAVPASSCGAATRTTLSSGDSNLGNSNTVQTARGAGSTTTTTSSSSSSSRNSYADDIARAKHTYMTYLAATAVKRSSPQANYEDVKAICLDRNTLQNYPDVSSTNLRKVSSSTNVPSSDNSRYINVTLPNVISDAVTSTEPYKLLPTDLYFSSDNKVYNITGYTNSLDRVNRRHAGYPPITNQHMEHVKNGTNNLSKHVDVVPEMSTANFRNRSRMNNSNGRPSSDELKLNVSIHSNFQDNTTSSRKSFHDDDNATMVSSSDASNFVIVSAPEGFVSNDTATLPSPQTPSGSKVRTVSIKPLCIPICLGIES